MTTNKGLEKLEDYRKSLIIELEEVNRLIAMTYIGAAEAEFRKMLRDLQGEQLWWHSGMGINSASWRRQDPEKGWNHFEISEREDEYDVLTRRSQLLIRAKMLDFEQSNIYGDGDFKVTPVGEEFINAV